MFPIVFGRKGGGNISIMEEFTSHDLKFDINNYIERFTDLSNLKNKIIEKLFDIIKKIDDENIRSQLIELKRDLFNDRPLKKYNSIIHEIKLTELSSYLLKKKELVNYENSIKSNFYYCLQYSLTVLTQLKTSYFLTNGLLFSSPILYKQYIKKDFTKFSYAKKERRLLISILKYLTRSITKTTPFSSFNSVFYLKENGGKYLPGIIYNASKIQISNVIYYYFKEIILNKTLLRETFKIKVNSSFIEINEGRLLKYYDNTENNEAFKNINNSPVLNYIVKSIDSESVSYTGLINILLEAVDETEKNIKDYVNKLIDEGFLKIIYPFNHESTNWIEEIIKYFENLDITDDSVLTKLKKLLLEIRSTINHLENDFVVENRKNKIVTLYNKIISFLNKYGISDNYGDKLKHQDLFYEDTFSNEKKSIKKEFLRKPVLESQILINYFNQFSYKKFVKVQLCKILEENGISKISLIEFYEKIYLKIISSINFDKKFLYELNHDLSKINNYIVENNFSANTIDIKEFLTIETKSINRFLNYGAFVQPNDKDWNYVVLNSYSKGMGSNFSRFFSHLNSKDFLSIKDFNERSSNDVSLVDLKDGSIHNLNNLPRIGKFILDLTDSKNYEEIIKLKDIYLIYEHNEIFLKDKHDNKIKPFDYSFEGIDRRSDFFKFLDIFNETDDFAYKYFGEYLNHIYTKNLSNKDVVSIPRITFGHSLILKRRKWIVKKESLFEMIATVNHKKNYEHIFLRINTWRCQYGLPDEVFVRIGKKNVSNLGNDDYKPQYINFRSPIFIFLLIDLISKSKDFIEIEEMYPNTDSIKDFDGFVREYLLNVA